MKYITIAAVAAACLLALGACGGGDDSSNERETTTAEPATTTTTTQAATTTTVVAPTVEEWFADVADPSGTCTEGWEGSDAQTAGVDSIDFNRYCREVNPPRTIPPFSSTTTPEIEWSREARVAVQRCLDELIMPGTFIADLSLGYDAQAQETIDACGEASLQVGVDAPGGSLLAVTLSFLNVRLLDANLIAATNPDQLDAVAFAQDVQPDLDRIADLILG